MTVDYFHRGCTLIVLGLQLLPPGGDGFESAEHVAAEEGIAKAGAVLLFLVVVSEPLELESKPAVQQVLVSVSQLEFSSRLQSKINNWKCFYGVEQVQC